MFIFSFPSLYYTPMAYNIRNMEFIETSTFTSGNRFVARICEGAMTMEKALFDDLVQSLKEAKLIARGEVRASRRIKVMYPCLGLHGDASSTAMGEWYASDQRNVS